MLINCNLSTFQTLFIVVFLLVCNVIRLYPLLIRGGVGVRVSLADYFLACVVACDHEIPSLSL